MEAQPEALKQQLACSKMFRVKTGKTAEGEI
jgi:hypothetical protein